MKVRVPIIFLIVYFIPALLVSGQWSPTPEDIRRFNSGPGDASVRGTIKDTKGRRLPNAVVTLRKLNGPNRLKKTVKTSSNGYYKFSRLPSGLYSLSTRVPGAPVIVKKFSLHASFLCYPCMRPVSDPDRLNLDISVKTKQRPVKPPDTDILSEIEKQIIQIREKKNIASFAISFPPTISLDKAEEVNFKLSLSRSMKELLDNLRKIQPKGDNRAAQTAVTPFIKPILSGDGVEITPVVSDGLPVTTQDVSQWLWNVKATRTGKLKLNFVLKTIIKPSDGKEYEETLDIQEKFYEIEQPFIETTAVKAIAASYQWLWTTLVLPLGIGIWGLLKRKKNQRKAGFV